MFCHTAEMNTAYAADCSGWFSAAMAPLFPILADIAEAVSIILFGIGAFVRTLASGSSPPVTSTELAIVRIGASISWTA